MNISYWLLIVIYIGICDGSKLVKIFRLDFQIFRFRFFAMTIASQYRNKKTSINITSGDVSIIPSFISFTATSKFSHALYKFALRMWNTDFGIFSLVLLFFFLLKHVLQSYTSDWLMILLTQAGKVDKKSFPYSTTRSSFSFLWAKDS